MSAKYLKEEPTFITCEMEMDEDTNHFPPEAQCESTLSAPSAWMLQVSIADRLRVYCTN